MNVPPDEVLSVNQLNQQIKHLLEGNYSSCWLRGEISNFRRQSSGHCYFSLKDAKSQISAVLFRGDATRLNIDLKEGEQVIVNGRVTAYEPRGTYQIICRTIIKEGEGRLQLEFERLKKKLAEEGLFDADRKQVIPVMPKKIAVITSPTGAAVQDFLRILKRRNWGGHVIVLSAKVQGVEAPEEIIQRVKDAQSIGGVELIVLTRGGGSIEDLWAFNNEALARTVADCPIPTISAIGHEIDFVLTDFVSDKRVETPSGAAELISSYFIECLDRINRLGAAMDESVFGLLERHMQELRYLGSRLEGYSPVNRLEALSLKLDDLQNRLLASFRGGLYQNNDRLNQLSQRLFALSPVNEIHLMKAHVQNLESRFEKVSGDYILNKQDHLKSLDSRLKQSSIQQTLKRGYAMVRTIDGKIISSKKPLKPGDKLVNQFVDGDITVQVE